MPITRTYTIPDLLSIGSTVDLTHYKTSINDDMQGIKYIVSNIYDDYMDDLLQLCVEVRLTDDEYYMFRYRPKLLAYHLYKTVDLDFLLAKVNNVVSNKDFDFRVLNVIRPDMIDQIYRIYEEEKKYIRTIDIKNVLSLDEFYYSKEGKIMDDLNKLMDSGSAPPIIGGGGSGGNNDGEIIFPPGGGGGSSGGGGGGTGPPSGGCDCDNEYNDLLTIIKELQKEIERIDNSITEILKELLDKNLHEIIDKITDEKYKEKLIELEDRIKDLEDNMPDAMEDRFDELLELIDDLYDKIYNIEQGNLDAVGIKTRDIVLKMDGKFQLGVVHYTEFRVPYNGNIISAVVSVNTSADRSSNIIYVLQVYDEKLKMWFDKSIMDLQADILYDRFDINERMDENYIRIYIKAGDVEKITSSTIIFSLIEDEEEEDENED